VHGVIPPKYKADNNLALSCLIYKGYSPMTENLLPVPELCQKYNSTLFRPKLGQEWQKRCAARLPGRGDPARYRPFGQQNSLPGPLENRPGDLEQIGIRAKFARSVRTASALLARPRPATMQDL
jgi:hypothetical protein